jgi:hypothetical protein
MTYRLAETDIYDFAGWLTTREGVMKVGASSEACSMAEAVGEYIDTFPERFSSPPQPTNIEELDTKSYLIGRYDSTKTLTDEEISAVWASKKYDGEHFVDYIEFARDLLRKAQEK